MAELLGISKPTAYKLANSEGFPLLKIGKRKLIPLQRFLEWVDKNSKDN
jgi:excisionase family DNA binding protein